MYRGKVQVEFFFAWMNRCYIMEMVFKPFATVRSKIHLIREWWGAKSPGEKWDSIYDIGRAMCDLIGVRVLSDNRVNWFSACGGLSAALYVLLNIYTIQYYLRRDEFVRGMECMFLVGVVIGVNEKIILFFGRNFRH